MEYKTLAFCFLFLATQAYLLKAQPIQDEHTSRCRSSITNKSKSGQQAASLDDSKSLSDRADYVIDDIALNPLSALDDAVYDDVYEQDDSSIFEDLRQNKVFFDGNMLVDAGNDIHSAKQRSTNYKAC